MVVGSYNLKAIEAFWLVISFKESDENEFKVERHANQSG